MTLSAQLQNIQGHISEHMEELISLRRHLHAHPELSRHELETTALLAERLRVLGFDVRVRPEGTGIIADLAPDGFGVATHPTVAIRADMDALPITEANEVDYRSMHAGVMHACGHDVHMTCTMGALTALAKMRSELPGRLRIIYQHAEETAPSGAPEMIEFGAMQDVSAIVALHCDPEIPVGQVGLKVGPLCASFDRFIYVVRGTGGHGARPHHCVDPIFVGTQLCQALYQVTGRSFDAREPVVLSVGEFQAGHAPNVIPETARLSGTVRTVSNEARARVEDMLNRMAKGVCEMYGASYELDLYKGAPAIINDAEVVEAMREVAVARLGPEPESVRWLPLPSMGSEDFSCYLAHAPGAMFRLGTKPADRAVHLLHSDRFNIDERAIGHGAHILAATALKMLYRHASS
jgi:amidohydrolase